MRRSMRRSVLVTAGGSIFKRSRRPPMTPVFKRRADKLPGFVAQVANTTVMTIEHEVTGRQVQQAFSSPIASGRYRR
jgi:hypothetical protein